MIFLSHNHNDKVVVEQFALRLRDIFGQNKVFYDSWSIQPGDGIVDKMNEGLRECKLFLFFVSKNSLQSNMVKLEWQNALIKHITGDAKIIPIKMDSCLMPPILMQSLYIDLFGNGLEIALRQVVDVLSGKNTFNPGPQKFSNLRAYLYKKDNSTKIEVHAEHFLEPISHFLFMTSMKKEDVNISYKSGDLCVSGFNEGIKLQDGRVLNGQLIKIERGTVPGFPMVVEAISPTGKTVDIDCVLHETQQGQWAPVPLVYGQKNA